MKKLIKNNISLYSDHNLIDNLEIDDQQFLNIYDAKYLSNDFQEPILVIIENLNDLARIKQLKIVNFISSNFSKEELNLRAQIAIDSYHQHEQLTNKINLDCLTQLYNKNLLHKSIDKLIFSRELFSIIMMDIDNFKKVNLDYGHIKADEYLKQLADLLKKSVRENDLIFRFGGEEFIIIAKTISKDLAPKIVARITDNISKILPFTLSFGISFSQIDDNSKSILARADQALLAAKKAGKNSYTII
jgi:diguanylate cyclase (GGDEF)-like protein